MDHNDDDVEALFDTFVDEVAIEHTSPPDLPTPPTSSQQLAHVLHTRQLLLGYLDKGEKLLPVLPIGMLRLCGWALVRTPTDGQI